MSISKASTFRNILYTSLGKGLTLCCVALTGSVVARNLAPSDYGVVGFALIIIGFLTQFSDMGVANAAIRRPQLSADNLNAAVTLKLLLSVAAMAGALGVAPFARHFFDHPATGNVIRVLALNFLASTVGFASLVVLTREMNYRSLVVPGVAGAVAQCALAIILVLRGWSYWAVVIANVGSVLTTGIVMTLARRVRLRLRFDSADIREYLRFGLPFFGSGVLVFLVFNLDNLLVGAAMGSTKLGYYAISFTWGSFICGILSSTVNNVLFPAFSAIQNDPAAVRRWYLKTIDLVAFIAVVANTALLANTHSFLVTLLGKGTDKWLPAVASLRILCIYGILRAISEPLSPCIMASGETKTLLQAAGLAGVVEVVLLLLGLRSGQITLVAGAVLLAYASQMVIYLPFLRGKLSVNLSDIAARVWPVVPALGVGWFLTSLLSDDFGGTFLEFGVRLLLTATVVALTHGLLTRFRCFREAASIVTQTFDRRISLA